MEHTFKEKLCFPTTKKKKTIFPSKFRFLAIEISSYTEFYHYHPTQETAHIN